jgi:steroid delta-isomerase-like uncharacterized protein
MSEGNKAIIRRLYEELNRGNFAAFDELIADSFVEHEVIPGVEPTKAGVRALFEGMRAAFEGFAMVPEDLVAEGDKVVVRATMRGTQRGEFLGIPASGRVLDMPVADFFRIAGGQVVEHWGVNDSWVMMQQLGVA